jgi:hypothetical protein
MLLKLLVGADFAEHVSTTPAAVQLFFCRPQAFALIHE